MGNPQAGDIGTKIRYNAQESLIGQTVLKLKWKKKPTNVNGKCVLGTIGEWEATIYDGTYAEYTTLIPCDLIAGTMEIQIYIETPTWQGHSEIKEITIDPNVS